MFSCCALFNTEDRDKDDIEHLKALEELEMEAAIPSNDLSMTVEDKEIGVDAAALTLEGTPMTASLEMSSRTAEDPKSMTSYEDPATETKNARRAPPSEEQEQAALGKGKDGGGFFEPEAADGVTELGTVMSEKADETLRALRVAEDTSRVAAAEAERRRFEEEASDRAARQAESEARKAHWRADEAQPSLVQQRIKEKGGTGAARAPMGGVTSIGKKGDEAAPSVTREEAEIANEAARKHVTGLLTGSGIRLRKHGRKGSSANRRLRSPDGECRTITWGSDIYDLKTMQEARKGTDDDPDFPGFKGTPDLRKSKTTTAAMDRSFSLIFSSRSLDFTAATPEECDMLIKGFNALSAKAQQG